MRDNTKERKQEREERYRGDETGEGDKKREMSEGDIRIGKKERRAEGSASGGGGGAEECVSLY